MAKRKLDHNACFGKRREQNNGEVLRERIRVRSQVLMQTEVAGLIGPDRHERTSVRATYRNGYRTRTWDRRMGTVELVILNVRAETWSPSPLQRRYCAEHAVLAVVREAYVHCVSPRKVR